VAGMVQGSLLSLWRRRGVRRRNCVFVWQKILPTKWLGLLQRTKHNPLRQQTKFTTESELVGAAAEVSIISAAADAAARVHTCTCSTYVR
jgi:hypothetical protein